MLKNIPATITHKEVMKILGLSADRAQKRLTLVRVQLNKRPRKPILLAEFCRAEDLNLDDVKEILKN